MENTENENYSNINQSIKFFENKTFDEYQEWLDINLKLNKFSPIFLFLHLHNFTKLYSSHLGYQKYFYLEKSFYLALEFHLLDVARGLYQKFRQEFGDEPKIIRMKAQLMETETIDQIDDVIHSYKKLINYNQEDKISIKRYIGLIKPILMSENINKYIEIWNEYLKVYMDDYEAWYELSDIYIISNNFNKAIFCLEEVLLHQPNNFAIYTKIGDMLCSFNNSESAANSIKYYSQSILLKTTPRAFWGLLYALNIIYKANKTLDQKNKNLLKISVIHLQNYYSLSPFKFEIEQLYNINLIE